MKQMREPAKPQRLQDWLCALLAGGVTWGKIYTWTLTRLYCAQQMLKR